MNPMLAIDQALHSFIYTLHTPLFTRFFFAFTNFGGVKIVTALVILISLILLLKNRKSEMVALWMAIGGSELITFLIKIIVNRSRPLDALYLESSASFPSGHATAAIALYGFVCYLSLKRTKKSWPKKFIIALTIFFALLLGFSRLYLGVHYLFDVLAGYLIGTLGLWVAINFDHKKSGD